MQIVYTKKPWNVLEQNLFFHHWYFHTDSLPDKSDIGTMASDIAGHIPAKSPSDVIAFYHLVLNEVRRILGNIGSQLLLHSAFGRLALPLLHRLRGCHSSPTELKEAFTRELFARVANHPQLKSLPLMPARYQKLASGGFVANPAAIPPPWQPSKHSSSPQPPTQYNCAPALQFNQPVGTLGRVPSLPMPPPQLQCTAPQHQLSSPSPPVCARIRCTNPNTIAEATLIPDTKHRSPLRHEATTGECVIVSE